MWVFVHGENGVMKEIQSDSSGNWTVDFTDEYDIQLGTEGSLKVFDSDQDMTHADWRVPNPSFSARITDNQVHGYEWPLGAQVSMTIDGVSYGPITVETAPVGFRTRPLSGLIWEKTHSRPDS